MKNRIRPITQRAIRTNKRRFSIAKLWMEKLEDRTTPSGVPGLPSLDGLDLGVQSYDPTQILVRFRPEARPELAPLPVGQAGRELMTDLFEIRLPEGVSVEQAVAAYEANPNVLYAQPDYIVSFQLIPNDPSFGSLYGLHNTGQSGGTVDADIDAPEAWDITTGSAATVIAVIDSGVDWNHTDLAANIWTNSKEVGGVANVDDDGNGFVDDFRGWDFVNNDNNPTDDNGHGTHVAGTIGAIGDNNNAVVGVNWNVKIMPLKFLNSAGSGSTSNAILALNYAVANGARISNNSWGGGGFSQALANAIDSARTKGHIFVAAAGNNASNNDVTPFYPANYNFDNVVSVAATDRNDKLASFSNYGATTVDLGAPGVSILSTAPGNGLATLSGTSMAAPHVSGVLGLVLSVNPSLTYSQAIARVLTAVDPIPALAGKTVTGGRLNAFRAVADVNGPFVTAHSPSGQIIPPVNGVQITFNEDIDANTFTAADVVSFTGPGGVDLISKITGVSGSGKVFTINFSNQFTNGDYSLTFGPQITDLAGNLMNQDQDGTNGETPADRYTATFTIDSTATFNSTDVPKTIVDGQTTISTLTVSPSLVIGDINVRLNISHTWDSDLILKLRAPSGTEVTLSNRRGGSGDNFTNTVFDDEAGTPISGGAAPFAGSFRPETPLSALDFQNAQGTWQLLMQDVTAPDPGILNSWSITVEMGFDTAGAQVTSSTWNAGTILNKVDVVFNESIDASTFTTADIVSFTGPGGVNLLGQITSVTGAGTNYTINFNNQTALGNYAMTFGPNIADTAGNLMNQDGDGTNGEIPDDRYTTTYTLTSTQTFNSTDVPKNILDGQTVISTLTVGPSLVIGDLNVKLNISHTYDSDLTLKLRAPSGTEVTLSNRRGGSGDNFTNTIFDDEAATPISGGAAPFAGSFRPETPLSAYDFQNAQGTWQLIMQDAFAPDPGVLNSWSISIEPGVDTSGAQVISSTWNAGTILNKVDVTFNESVDASTFTTADIVSFTGPGGVNLLGQITSVTGAGANYTINFSNQTALGTYTMTFGPNIADLVGNLMNQDGDGTNGEIPDDRYTTSYTLTSTQTFTSTDVPKTIPNASTVISTLTVGPSLVIGDLNLKLNISHTYDSDLVLKLRAPSGTEVTLSNRRGGSGDNFTDTIFDDEAATPISGGAAPFAGSFRPETPFSVFDFQNAQGTWQLIMQDVLAPDPGVLNSWSITIEPGVDTSGAAVTSSTWNAGTILNKVDVTFNESVDASTFTTADIVSFTGPGGVNLLGQITSVTGAGANYTINFNNQTALGTYTMTFGPNIADLVGNLMNQDGDGTNGEIPDDRYTTSYTLTSTQTFTSTDVPKTIPNGTTVISTLTVGPSLVIGDLNIKLDISHTYDSDLILKLRAPSGTEVTLANRRGGSGDNFTNTIFDDEAATPISAGSPPFTGSFQPETTLSAFDGQNAQGVWQLIMQDVIAPDPGVLNSWSISIEPQEGGGGNGPSSFGSTSSIEDVPMQPAGVADYLQYLNGFDPALALGAPAAPDSSRFVATHLATRKGR